MLRIKNEAFRDIIINNADKGTVRDFFNDSASFNDREKCQDHKSRLPFFIDYVHNADLDELIENYAGVIFKDAPKVDDGYVVGQCIDEKWAKELDEEYNQRTIPL